MNHITFYSKSGDVLDDSKSHQSKWDDIIPDSGLESFFNQILKDYNIKR